ncbi:hypothetical protein MMC27_002361 [Xylographa pallens]|nr:hypothetical protein [Xylographa pallens]
MPDQPFTSTGAMDESGFTVVASTKQQTHFREKEAKQAAREKAWKDTAKAVERERERRRHNKEWKAANEERIRRAWKKEEARVAAKREEMERIKLAWDKEEARVAAKRAEIAQQHAVEDEARKAKVKNERSARSVEFDELWCASKGEMRWNKLFE